MNAKYDKKEIMKRAWNCYRKHNDTMTFGQCLAWSWKKAKQAVRDAEMAILDEIGRRNRQRMNELAAFSGNWKYTYGSRYSLYARF